MPTIRPDSRENRHSEGAEGDAVDAGKAADCAAPKKRAAAPDAVLRNLHVQTRLYFDARCEGEDALGPREALLMQNVKAKGSLFAAAREISMSYSMAWDTVNRLENALSTKLVVRNKTKGYTLTPEAERILESYTSISEGIARKAKRDLDAMKG